MSVRNPLSSLPPAIRNSCALCVYPAAGTYKDWSSNELTVSVQSSPRWQRVRSRFGLVCTDGYLQAAADAALNATSYSFFVAGDFKLQETDYIFQKIGDVFRFYVDASNLRLYDGATDSALAYSYAGARSLGCTVTTGAAPKFYVDGAYVGVGGSVVTVASTNAAVNVFGATGGKAGKWAAYLSTDILTVAQMASLHTWSEAARSPSHMWPGHGSGNLSRPSRVNGREKGLVGAWDLGEMVGGVVADLSGNGNDGTVVGNVHKVNTPAGSAGKFDGLDGSVNVGTSVASSLSVSNNWTFVMLANLRGDGTIRGLFGSKNSSSDKFGFVYDNHFRIQASLYTAAGYDGITRVVVPEGLYHLVFTNAGGTTKCYINGDENTNGIGSVFPNITGAVFGKSSSASGCISSILQGRVYDYVWDQNAVTKDYNEFAKLLTYADGPESWNVTLADEGGLVGQRLSTTPWKFGDTVGRWSVIDDTVQGEPTRVIQCETAGLLYLPSDQAYGTWEFDFYKAAGSDIYALFMADTIGSFNATGQDGYQLQIDNTEAVGLQEINSGVASNLAYTGASYVADSTWYRARLTRRYDGQFYVYLLGGAFTTWTLMSISGGGGTNPVTDATNTESLFSVLDLDAGDRFTGFVRRNGVWAP